MYTVKNADTFACHSSYCTDVCVRAGGFSLELGLKDVSLVSQAARESGVPMPVLSVLLDRFVSARSRGRGELDWSAAGLGAAEDAGIDIAEDLSRNHDAVKRGETY
jgi:3-hydroxyisobutyrate dehydrogenase-like beta-hydroxyacid dehydrogenase